MTSDGRRRVGAVATLVVAAACAIAAVFLDLLPLSVIVPGPALAARMAQDRADGRAVLVIGQDNNLTDDRLAASRHEEARADVVLVARWLQSCDRLVVAAVPRDIVFESTGGMPVSVFHGLVGVDALADAMEAETGIDVVASIVLDLADADALSHALGAVEIQLPVASRDLRTGFAGGPGAKWLEGKTAVAFLRARAWEEYRNGEWVAVAGDLHRIERQQQYLSAAIARLTASSLRTQFRVGLAAITSLRVSTRDPIAAFGFAVGASSVDDVAFSTLATEPELGPDERRSPFPPSHMGAFARLVPAADSLTTLRTTGCSTLEAGP